MSQVWKAALCTGALVLGACSSSTNDGGNPDSGGCTTCTTDAGGGPPPGACTAAQKSNPLCLCDGGSNVSVAQTRAFLAGTCPAPAYNGVVISGAVVTGVMDAYKSKSTGLPGGYGTKSVFWVADSSAPQNGIWVEKYTTDWAVDMNGQDYLYFPTPGDVVTVDGFAVVRQPSSFVSYFQEYRPTIGDEYLVNAGSAPLQLTLTASGTPPADNTAPSGFGNAQGGTVAANPELSGARVHIPGPLTLTNGSPVAMQNFDTSSTFPPVPIGWNGFEVTGGVLVSDYKTHETFRTIADGGADGGPIKVPSGGCGYAEWVRDGGSVTFPDGISGVWDTYSVQPCSGPVPDGGQYCNNALAEFPLADGGFQTGFLYVLWPLSCADLDGGLMQ